MIVNRNMFSFCLQFAFGVRRYFDFEYMFVCYRTWPASCCHTDVPYLNPNWVIFVSRFSNGIHLFCFFIYLSAIFCWYCVCAVEVSSIAVDVLRYVVVAGALRFSGWLISSTDVVGCRQPKCLQTSCFRLCMLRWPFSCYDNSAYAFAVCV